MIYISDQYPKMILHKSHVPVLRLEVGDFNVHGGLLSQINQAIGISYEKLTPEKIEEIIMDLYKSTGTLLIDRSGKVSTPEKKEEKERV